MEKEKQLNIDDYKFLSHIINAHIVDSYNEYDVPIDTEEHINKLRNVFNKLENKCKELIELDSARIFPPKEFTSNK